MLTSTVNQLPRTLPTYWAILGCLSILQVGRELRDREREAMALETRLVQSQLDLLRLQIQPHFLFNTLNGISTLLHRDPQRADEMIGHLSTLLRDLLREKNSNEVPLSRELELLEAYVKIEQMRFSDRIRFVKEVSGECRIALVPPLLLQPLVENSVRHGLEPLQREGSIWIKAWVENRYLHLEVEDNGIGIQENASGGAGLGLKNAEARLQALYGEGDYTFTLEGRPGGGARVAIRLPHRTVSG